MKVEVPQEFIDSINAMPIDALKALVVNLQVRQQENEAFKDSDVYQAEVSKLKIARDKFNEVAGPVRDLAKLLKLETNLVLERLKERGAL